MCTANRDQSGEQTVTRTPWRNTQAESNPALHTFFDADCEGPLGSSLRWVAADGPCKQTPSVAEFTCSFEVDGDAYYVASSPVYRGRSGGTAYRCSPAQESCCQVGAATAQLNAERTALQNSA